jgi:hypothetical protein
LENNNLNLTESISANQQGLLAASSTIGLLQNEISEIYDLLNNSSSTQPLVVAQPDLDAQTLAVQQAATFYGTISVIGEAGFKSKVVFENDIEVKGKIYASADQAGTAIILANTTSTEITFANEYAVTPKVTVSLQGAKPVFYGIENKTQKGFKIVLTETYAENLTFDWIVLAVKDEGLQIVLPEPETPALVLGCMDSEAANYNSEATQDDGSCLPAQTVQIPPEPETPTVVLGCMDSEASNYNSEAMQDDGSCAYPLPVATNPPPENNNDVGGGTI